MVLVGVGAASFACLGEDANPGVDVADAGGSDASAPDASVDAGVVPDAAGDDPVTTAACPADAPAPVACGPALVNVGAPALHLDACALAKVNGRITEWPSTDGNIVMKGNPGALLCQSTFNGRPAVHFDRDGFQLAAGDAVALDTAPEFWLAIVMQYTPGTRPRSAAGGTVFGRTAANYPFFGPQVTADFAYQAQVGAPTSYEPTTLLGGAMRFGVKSRGIAESTFAAVTEKAYGDPMLVVFRRLGNRLSLSVNGTEVASEERPDGSTLSDGTGSPVWLGRSSGDNGFLLGKVSEVLFYKSTPNMTPDLEKELMGRWGVGK